MAELTRDVLDGFFQTGFKPTQQNFEDVFDSMINIQDDHIDPFVDGVETYLRIGFGGTNTLAPPMPRLEVNGGIRLGSLAPLTGPNLEGTLIYDGTQLQIHDGTGFNPVGAGGGGIPGITSVGGNITLAATANTNTITHNVGGSPIMITSSQGVDIIGDLTVSGTVNGTIICDERLKKDIRPLDWGWEELKNLDPVKFKYNGKAGTRSDQEGIGVIAQQLKEIMPELVVPFSAKLEPDDKEETELYRIDTRSLTLVLINAVKELGARVEQLEQMVKEAPMV